MPRTGALKRRDSVYARVSDYAPKALCESGLRLSNVAMENLSPSDIYAQSLIMLSRLNNAFAEGLGIACLWRSPALVGP